MGRVKEFETRTQSSEALPDQAGGDDCAILNSTSSSAGAEPATSNEASFKEDESQAAEPRCRLSADCQYFQYMGSSFDHTASNTSGRNDFGKLASDDDGGGHNGSTPKKRKAPRKGRNSAAAFRPDPHEKAQDAESQDESDDETVGHTQDAETGADDDDIAEGKDN